MKGRQMSVNQITESTLITDHDVYLFKEGSHFALYEKLGSHVVTRDGRKGTHFAVWAPNARRISVIGDFNDWRKGVHPMQARPDGSGVWEAFIEGIGNGAVYKYHIESSLGGYQVDKGDPFARYWELPPKTASIVWDELHEWKDQQWMQTRAGRNALAAPISVYEMHAGSWRRVPEEGNRSLTYRELAHQLADYCTESGFTHVELLPIMEHPFYGSWGYLTLGYFAPTRRYGTPSDFKYFVDYLHQRGIGVILDWVPSHFPADEYGLNYFDGSHLFEHADPRRGWHPDWQSCIFNLGRNEVRAFLISSAMFWLNECHVDGLRVDAVASMLYLDYSRKEGEWVPNHMGGRENLESISLLRRLNEIVHEKHPDVMTVAEESTSWPMVSRPAYAGGLGFDFKWNMGWMSDTLSYFRKDPIHRQFHHNQLTFSIWYAFNEQFMLSLSHDEVVHGKGSLLNKMPGDEWQQFANLRLLYGYMFTHPGKKLLFMGDEFGQQSEWNHDSSLEWHVLQYPLHGGLRRWVGDLNRLLQAEEALHMKDFEQAGFEWVDCNDYVNSVLTYMRYGRDRESCLLIGCNYTPIPRHNYRVGVPHEGVWTEILNSDAKIYGGSGQGNLGGIKTAPVPYYDRHDFSISLTLPPLGVVVFKWDPASAPERVRTAPKAPAMPPPPKPGEDEPPPWPKIPGSPEGA